MNYAITFGDSRDPYITAHFLCSLDVENIDDQCRSPSVKEKDHLVG